MKRPVSRPKKPKGPRNLKAHGFTDGSWRLDERDQARAARTQRPPPPRFTRIEQHSDEELENAIAQAVRLVPDFFKILHGIDAYQERRRRRKIRAVRKLVPFAIHPAEEWDT